MFYCLIDGGPRAPVSAATMYVTVSGKSGPGCPGYKPIPNGTPVTGELPTPITMTTDDSRVGDFFVCDGRGSATLRIKLGVAVSQSVSNKTLTAHLRRLPHGDVRVRCAFR